MTRPKIPTLQPRIRQLGTILEEKGLKMYRAPRKTLQQRQQETGRTLGLSDAPWRRLRASVLAEEPLCRHCAARGLVVEATDVDHINNDPADNSSENLQPLCHECHSRKTAADMGHRVNHGCDVSGMPLDPRHPWNIEKSR